MAQLQLKEERCKWDNRKPGILMNTQRGFLITLVALMHWTCKAAWRCVRVKDDWYRTHISSRGDVGSAAFHSLSEAPPLLQ